MSSKYVGQFFLIFGWMLMISAAVLETYKTSGILAACFIAGVMLIFLAFLYD